MCMQAMRFCWATCDAVFQISWHILAEHIKTLPLAPFAVGMDFGLGRGPLNRLHFNFCAFARRETYWDEHCV